MMNIVIITAWILTIMIAYHVGILRRMYDVAKEKGALKADQLGFIDWIVYHSIAPRD